jgi:hypothetical protein
VVFAHIAGIPVEETVLSFAPVGALAFSAGVRSMWRRATGRVRKK